MLIAIYVLKLLASLSAIKNKLKIVGRFLFINLLLDIFTQIMIYLRSSTIAGTRPNFVLFGLAAFGFLANGANLLYHSGATLENKTLKHNSLLSLISILGFVLLCYPVLTTAQLFLAYYIYYFVVSFISIGVLIKNLRANLSFNTGLMSMLSLGCIAELIMVVILGVPYQFVSVCNCIFYTVILGACSLVPRYKNLLKP